MARAAYVHEAVLVLDPGEDPRRPGAMVTVELCGHWEHEGPCRWPHHTAVVEGGDGLVVRTTFVAEPAERDVLLIRIGAALRAQTGWRVKRAGEAELTDEEQSLGSNLLETPLPDTP